jgi:hypothetical protein
MQSVSIAFTFIGEGWADCELRLGDKHVKLTSISYLTDALGDLLRFALMIATGADSASVSFDREPAQWHLIATSLLDSASGRGPVSIAVFDTTGEQPTAPDDRVFIGDCEALDFAQAVLIEMQRLQKSLGDQGWGVPYPVRALRALEAALSDR